MSLADEVQGMFYALSGYDDYEQQLTLWCWQAREEHRERNQLYYWKKRPLILARVKVYDAEHARQPRIGRIQSAAGQMNRKQKRDDRRRRGLCIECGAPASGKQLCATHADAQSMRRAKKAQQESRAA